MSLRTADFFYKAISTSDEVVAIADERIFLPARPTIDEQQDTIPYIIIEPGTVTNGGFTKDNTPEGREDNATVSVLCVAESHDRLMDLCEAVRDSCVTYWQTHRDDPTTPVEWQFTASEEVYDYTKPCNYLTLTYQCTTSNC